MWTDVAIGCAAVSSFVACVLSLLCLLAVLEKRAAYHRMNDLLDLVRRYLEDTRTMRQDVVQDIKPTITETKQLATEIKSETAKEDYARDGTHRILGALQSVTSKLDCLLEKEKRQQSP